MAHLPTLERFVALSEQADFVPVYRELLSDALSPVQAFARLDRGEAAGLFESVIGGEKVGRYSCLAVDPFVELIARGHQVTIREGGQETTFDSPDPLDELRSRRTPQPSENAVIKSPISTALVALLLCLPRLSTAQEPAFDYIYEPTPAQIYERILPRHVEVQVWRALLESQAAEHGARMAAMDSASRNAGEMISRLTLYMNKVRQAAITKEIIEVVSGASAGAR